MPNVNALYNIDLSLTLEYILRKLNSKLRYNLQGVDLVNLPKRSHIIKKGIIKGLKHKDEISNLLLIKYNLSKKIGTNIENVKFDLAKSICEPDYSSKYIILLKTIDKFRYKQNLPIREYLKYIYDFETNSKYKTRTIGISLDQQYVNDIDYIRKYLLDCGVPLSKLPAFGHVTTYCFFVGLIFYKNDILNELYEECKKNWLYNTNITKGVIFLTPISKKRYIFQEESYYKKELVKPYSIEVSKIIKKIKDSK